MQTVLKVCLLRRTVIKIGRSFKNVSVSCSMDGVLRYRKHVFSNLVTDNALLFSKGFLPIVDTLNFHLFKDEGVFFTVRRSLSLIWMRLTVMTRISVDE